MQIVIPCLATNKFGMLWSTYIAYSTQRLEYVRMYKCTNCSTTRNHHGVHIQLQYHISDPSTSVQYKWQVRSYVACAQSSFSFFGTVITNVVFAWYQKPRDIKLICNFCKLCILNEILHVTPAVTKTRTGLGLDWDWTRSGLELLLVFHSLLSTFLATPVWVVTFEGLHFRSFGS